mgnify:CR=1 FL=1
MIGIGIGIFKTFMSDLFSQTDWTKITNSWNSITDTWD